MNEESEGLLMMLVFIGLTGLGIVALLYLIGWVVEKLS